MGLAAHADLRFCLSRPGSEQLPTGRSVFEKEFGSLASPSGGRPWSAWRAQKDCKAAKQLYGLTQRMQTREKRLSKGFCTTRQSKAVNPSEITEIDGINERGEGKTAGLEKRKGKRNSSWFSNWPSWHRCLMLAPPAGWPPLRPAPGPGAANGAGAASACIARAATSPAKPARRLPSRPHRRKQPGPR